MANIIKRIWNRKKEKIKANEAEEMALVEIREAIAMDEVYDARKWMTNSYCAINRMDYCTDGCVHFEEGYVSEPLISESTYFLRRLPRCRLWKE